MKGFPNILSHGVGYSLKAQKYVRVPDIFQEEIGEYLIELAARYNSFICKGCPLKERIKPFAENVH